MIHINIGSNLRSVHGSRFDNITIAINLLIDAKIKILKISNYYETPSYPKKHLPKFLNVGLLAYSSSGIISIYSPSFQLALHISS